jgi:malate-CoA ligase subunit beta
VVKAQIHSGGRGEAGGVKVCKTEAEVRDYAADLLGKTLVTKQTGAGGKVVHRLWVEEATDIAQEIYLGFVLDRKSERIMIVASGHGGMEIEDLAHEDPDSLVRMVIDPATGLVEFQARELAFRLGLSGKQIGQMVTTLRACYRAYRDLDAMMVEINPLAITGEGTWSRSTARCRFDTNALVPPPAGRRAARSGAGGRARGDGRRSRARLCGPRRRHRLHHQRRGPRHGHDGHDQAGRGRACELPRHRRRREPRAGRHRLQPC